MIIESDTLTKSSTFNTASLRILSDWDGVLFSWTDSVVKLLQLKKTPELVEKLKTSYKLEDLYPDLTREYLNREIELAGDEFWLNSPKLPWADELIELVTKLCPGNVAICTSLGSWPKSASPKFELMNKHFAKYGVTQLITCKHKGLVASPFSLLLDDMKYQTSEFEKCGGFSFTWENQYVLESDPQLLKKEFEKLSALIEFVKCSLQL